MIAFLSGIIKDAQSEKNATHDLILMAGQVGYLVKTPKSAQYEFLIPGEKVDLFIHSHIREDAFDLYGFLTQPEKSLFLSLLTINGVGPKMAMGILSQVSEESLVDMILSEDKESLTKIPGVGKKTAERIIIELREKLQKATAARPASSKSGLSAVSSATEIFVEASLALQALGYKELQARQMLEAAKEKGDHRKVEDLIRAALQKS